MGVLTLSHPMGFVHNGILYLVGYRGGSQYLRRSGDGGRSWLRYADGSVEQAIAASDAERAAFVKLDTQGARLVVGLPRGEGVAIYLSADDGMTWEYEGTVE